MINPDEIRTLKMSVREWRLVDGAMERMMEWCYDDAEWQAVFQKVFALAYGSED